MDHWLSHALRRRGRALVALLILAAGVCFVGGVLAAVALGGRSGPAPAPTPAPVMAGGGGFSGAAPAREPIRYAWLNRDQADIVALSQGREPTVETTAASTGPGGVTTASATTEPTGTETDPGTATSATEPPTQPASVVPKVVGKSLEEAEQLLAATGLAMSLKARKHSSLPAGRVASQWPAAGEVAPADGTVYITKSLGPAPKKKTTARRKRTGGCSAPCGRCHPGR